MDGVDAFDQLLIVVFVEMEDVREALRQDRITGASLEALSLREGGSPSSLHADCIARAGALSQEKSAAAHDQPRAAPSGVP